MDLQEILGRHEAAKEGGEFLSVTGSIWEFFPGHPVKALWEGNRAPHPLGAWHECSAEALRRVRDRHGAHSFPAVSHQASRCRL